MTALAEYIEKMRDRFPRLSYRAMAIDAGLSENAVYRIVKYGQSARPATLKAISDAWGRDPDEQATDYAELMRRAGYAVPGEPAAPAPDTELDADRVHLTVTERAVLNMFAQMPQATMDLYSTIVANDPKPGRLAGLVLGDLNPTDAELAAARRAATDRNGLPIPAFLLSEFDRWTLRRVRLYSPDDMLKIAAFHIRYGSVGEAIREFGQRLERVVAAEPSLIDAKASEPLTATERLALDVLRTLSPEEYQTTMQLLRTENSPGVLTRWMMSDIDVSDDEVQAWLDANDPEPRTEANALAGPLSEDEQYVLERLRAMPREGFAILAVGLCKFKDARDAGRALGPQLGQMWIDMTARIRDLDVPTQRRLLAVIQEQLAEEIPELTPGQNIPDEASLERLLGVVLQMSLEERTEWVCRNLRTLGLGS